jgi:Fe2+ transport system protein FeoA
MLLRFSLNPLSPGRIHDSLSLFNKIHMTNDVPAFQGKGSAIPLNKLEPGKCGLVVKVVADNDDAKRLMAMGVCTGQIIKLEQLGDPMILQVVGSKLGVSRRLGETVSVTPCDEETFS